MIKFVVKLYNIKPEWDFFVMIASKWHKKSLSNMYFNKYISAINISIDNLSSNQPPKIIGWALV